MTVHFDKVPADELAKVETFIRSSIEGMAEGAIKAGRCPSCLCHLIASIAGDMAEEYASEGNEKVEDIGVRH